MVAELMLVNPRRKARPRRAMSALQRKYFGGGRRKRAAAPRRRRRSAARAVTVVQRNPIRRRRRRSIMRARRNPISMRGTTGKITSALMPAAIGAAGGIGLNYILSTSTVQSAMPASLQSGIGNAAMRIVLGLALGWGVGKVAGKSIGSQVAIGAVTISLASVAASYMSGAGIGTGAYGGGASYQMNGLGANAQPMRMRRRRRQAGGMARFAGPMGAIPRPMMQHRLNAGTIGPTNHGMGYVGPGRSAGFAPVGMGLGRFVGS